jgi:hypothetical protein
VSTNDNCGELRSVVCGICSRSAACVANNCVSAPTISSVSVGGAPEIRQGRGVSGGDGPARVTAVGANLTGTTAAKLVYATSYVATGTVVSADASSLVFDVSVAHGLPIASYAIVLSGPYGEQTTTAMVAVTPVSAKASSGSDSGAGTPTSPFKSFARAAAVAGDGDTIQLDDGTYDVANGDTFTQNDNGASDKPPSANVAATFLGTNITVSAKNRRQALLVGDVTNPSNGDRLGIYLKGTQTVTIIGLRMSRFERALFLRDNAAASLVDVDFFDNSASEIEAMDAASVQVQNGPANQPSTFGFGESIAVQNFASILLDASASLSSNGLQLGGADNPLWVGAMATASLKNPTIQKISTTVGTAAIFVQAGASCAGCTSVTCSNCTLSGSVEPVGKVCRAGIDKSSGFRWSIALQDACIDFE